jgi:hypothetical protein
VVLNQGMPLRVGYCLTEGHVYRIDEVLFEAARQPMNLSNSCYALNGSRRTGWRSRNA